MAVMTWDKHLLAEARRLREDVARASAGERVLRHVPTGFEKLDGEFGGVRIGIVTELMAHTGDGKSAFMRQCAEAAARAGAGVLWFVLEDPSDATAERQFCGDTGLDSASVGRLDLSPEDLDRVQAAAEKAGSWAKRVCPVFEPLGWEEVLAAIDGCTTIGGAPLRAVFMDYAQLMGGARTLEDDIAELGKGLHGRSRERRFASMVGSQVVSDVIRRGRERWYQNKDITGVFPGLGDTEWCRRLEKLCKSAWALVRPERWKFEFGDETAVDDRAELHVRKQNFGPTGWVELGWDGPTTRFT